MNVVPPLVMMMALSPNITKEHHLNKVKVIGSGGSPLSSQVIEKLRGKLQHDCELKVRMIKLLLQSETNIVITRRVTG